MRVRLTAAAILAGGVLITAGCAGTPAALLHTGTDARQPAVRAPHSVTLAAAGQQHATLAVVSGAATVTVMPGDLARASTPANSQIRPQFVSAGGRVQLFLDSTGQGGPSAVTVRLSSAVTWQLEFSGGASQTVLSLGRGKVAGIDFTAGSSLIQMTLPRPAGTPVITLAGGASQATLTVPGGVPVRLRLYGGASSATLAGVTHTGLAGGTVLTPPGWAQAANRYDVDAPAGVSDIAVTG
jgi:hypothetical protein